MIGDNAGGPLNVNGLAVLGGTSMLGGLSGGGTLAAASQGAVLVVNQANDATFSGKFLDGADPLSLIKQGSAALSLSGSNSFSGGTTLNAGRLNINSAAAACRRRHHHQRRHAWNTALRRSRPQLPCNRHGTAISPSPVPRI